MRYNIELHGMPPIEAAMTNLDIRKIELSPNVRDEIVITNCNDFPKNLKDEARRYIRLVTMPEVIHLPEIRFLEGELRKIADLEVLYLKSFSPKE